MTIDKSFLDFFARSTEKGAYGASLFKGKNNKIAATPGGPGVAKNYIDMGYNLLNIGEDVVALSDYAEKLVNEFEKINS